MEQQVQAIFYSSPVGEIFIERGNAGIRKLVFDKDHDMRFVEKAPGKVSDPVCRQLDEYFSGRRRVFDLPLDLQGTEFQKRVWQELAMIPFGKTIPYKELAIRLGDVKRIRAAAAANGANPVSIIIPCHRVIGSDGSLTGYAGGLWRKQWLLDFEMGGSLF